MVRYGEKQCTRYGLTTVPSTKIGHEERFSWQKNKASTDGMYDLPDVRSSRVVTFGMGIRTVEQSNSDLIKRTTGPGSYEFSHCYDKISGYKHRQGNRFGLAPRESLDLKTLSPGAVYDITKQFWNGPDTSIKIGFNCDSRPPLCNPSLTADADMLYPKMPKGKSITIAGRIKSRNRSKDDPGFSYDVKDKKKGPSFSFGKGHTGRFNKIAFLPEIDD